MLEINKSNKYQIIEKYLKGELDSESKKVFDEKYQNDPEFREEVDQFHLVSYTFKNLSNDAVARIDKILLASEQQSRDVRKIVPIGRRKTFFTIAASVAIILVSGIIFLINFKKSEDLLTESAVINQFVVTIVPGENLGFAKSPEVFVDTVGVQVIENNQYHYHYSFNNDTLKLYLDENISSEKLTIKKREQDYMLIIKTDTLIINRGFETIKPLIRNNKNSL